MNKQKECNKKALRKMDMISNESLLALGWPYKHIHNVERIKCFEIIEFYFIYNALIGFGCKQQPFVMQRQKNLGGHKLNITNKKVRTKIENTNQITKSN
jgi:hypothetical protein